MSISKERIVEIIKNVNDKQESNIKQMDSNIHALVRYAFNLGYVQGYESACEEKE